MSSVSSHTSCLILAGGLGTRLRTAVPDRPKCLAPVGQRSFLEVQIQTMVTWGINDFVLSLGYMAEEVIDEVRHWRLDGVGVRWVVEPQALGTGGAINYAMTKLDLQEALVVNGDTLIEGDVSAMLLPLEMEKQEWLRMAVVCVPDRSRFGGVRMDAASRVTNFLEKGRSGPGDINAGVYRLRREAIVGESEAFSFEAVTMPKLAGDGKVTAVRIDGSFIDIGVPDDYHRFCLTHA